MPGFRVEKNLEMPMRDGTILRGDVWLQDGDEPRPALLMRTPNQKEEAFTDFLRLDRAVQAGYAVVVQDVRGRFASGGVWRGMTSNEWDVERTDSYDTVEWVAAQPWCDGNVGMFGLAGTATYGFLAAEEQAPSLKAVVAMMAANADQVHLDTGGAVRLEAVLSTYLFYVAAELPERVARGEVTPADAARISATMRDVAAICEFLPLRDAPKALDMPELPVPWDDFLAGEAGGKAPSFDYERVQVPFLLIGGWYDLANACSVDQFEQLRRRSTRDVQAEHRLLMGPWTHGDGGPTQGEVSFGYFTGAAARSSSGPACLSFFARHLRGTTDELPEVRYFLMGANEWRTADSWPPAERIGQWFLHSDGDANTLEGDGTLGPEPPSTAETPDVYRYDPHDPVRTRGGRCNRTSAAPGPVDQTLLERRPDVLCYTSAPLDEAVDIAGEPVLHLYADSSAVDTDFYVKLLDVDPHGCALEVASGLARARYRRGFDREVLLQPGRVECYTVGLGPTAARIRPGHRLRVHVCSSNFPFLDRNMNTGNALGADAEGVVAEQTVFHDVDCPSRLDLPVLGR